MQNRLTSVDPGVVYKYNADGIRVQKQVGTQDPIIYLIDPANHTGYAQVLRETQGSASTVYVLGHDVLAQATGADENAPRYLLYDGHGSVRQLAGHTSALISGQAFDYDAYGNLLGSPSPQTDLLYAGEMIDPDIGWYYNRACWYDPATGRFNRTDPFAAQSLRKYL